MKWSSSNCWVGVVRILHYWIFLLPKETERTNFFLERKLSVCKNCLFCRENGLLKETKSELEHAIAETERPLRYRKKILKNTTFLDGASIVLEFNFSLLPGSIMNVSRTERLGSASTWSRTRWRTVSRGRWRTSRPTSRGCRRCLQRWDLCTKHWALYLFFGRWTNK